MPHTAQVPERRSRNSRHGRPIRGRAFRGSEKRLLDAATVARLAAVAIEDNSRDVAAAMLESFSQGWATVDWEPFTRQLLAELIVRPHGRSDDNFSSEMAVAAVEAAGQRNPRVRGQALRQLRDLAYESAGGARSRSVVTASKLDVDEFRALVSERAATNPEAARDIVAFLGVRSQTEALAQRIQRTDPRDVQAIAATQVELLDNYYRDVLRQANTSFLSAVIAAAVGLGCLIASLVLLFAVGVQNVPAILTGVSSVISQFISATQFYLYAQTSKQLAYFHTQLNQTERF